MATLTNPKELLKFLMGHMLSDIEAELDVLASQPDSCSTGGRFMDLKGRYNRLREAESIFLAEIERKGTWSVL